MKYDFDKVINRHGTYSMKYDDDGYFHAMSSAIHLDQDTLRLMIADTDFQCAPAITKAMHRVADFPTFGYTTVEAAPEYKRAIISWYHRRFDYEIDPEWIIHASGALDGVGQTIRAFSNPGDGVIICSPVYSNFTSTIRRLHREVVNCQLAGGESGNYQIDWEHFEAACADEKTRYMFFAPLKIQLVAYGSKMNYRKWRKFAASMMLCLLPMKSIVILFARACGIYQF